MSFALEVKEEIVSHSFSYDQTKAFLSGFVRFNSEIIYSNSKTYLRLTTISNRIARTLLTFVRQFHFGETQISVLQKQTLKRNKTFNITLLNDVPNFLKSLKIWNDNNEIIADISDDFRNNSETFRAYVAGMFVAIGSVNSPTTTNYHLELQFKEWKNCNNFVVEMKNYRFNFKMLNRKDLHFIAYIKKSLLVSDFLKFVDAPQAVMRFENERISRDMVNNINRISNIDISNQAKTIKTGIEQVQKIKYIKSKKKMYLLSDKANVLANIRLKKPESSFLELENEMAKVGYSITKSGIANLFKSIDKVYQEIAKN